MVTFLMGVISLWKPAHDWRLSKSELTPCKPIPIWSWQIFLLWRVSNSEIWMWHLTASFTRIWYWRVIGGGDELCIDFPKLNSIVIGKGCFGGGYCVLIESVIPGMYWHLDLPELTTFMFGLDAFCFDRIDEDTEFTLKSCHDGWNSHTDLPKLAVFKGPRHRMHTFAELKHAHFICAIGISK